MCAGRCTCELSGATAVGPAAVGLGVLGQASLAVAVGGERGGGGGAGPLQAATAPTAERRWWRRQGRRQGGGWQRPRLRQPRRAAPHPAAGPFARLYGRHLRCQQCFRAPPGSRACTACPIYRLWLWRWCLLPWRGSLPRHTAVVCWQMLSAAVSALDARVLLPAAQHAPLSSIVVPVAAVALGQWARHTSKVHSPRKGGRGGAAAFESPQAATAEAAATERQPIAPTAGTAPGTTAHTDDGTATTTAAAVSRFWCGRVGSQC
jgi:hypothetical protein